MPVLLALLKMYTSEFSNSELGHSRACSRLYTRNITEEEQESPRQKVQVVLLRHCPWHTKEDAEKGKISQKKEKILPRNSKPLNRRKLSLNVCPAIDICFP